MKFDCLDVSEISQFDWDDGNILKNEQKHNLQWQRIEEIFFNEPLLIVEDFKHSQEECRCFALGKTDENEKLFVVFTARKNRIRIISARVMNQKERAVYENFKNNSEI